MSVCIGIDRIGDEKNNIIEEMEEYFIYDEFGKSLKSFKVTKYCTYFIIFKVILHVNQVY